jgi:hypothetical protein
MHRGDGSQGALAQKYSTTLGVSADVCAPNRALSVISRVVWELARRRARSAATQVRLGGFFYAIFAEFSAWSG